MSVKAVKATLHTALKRRTTAAGFTAEQEAEVLALSPDASVNDRQKGRVSTRAVLKMWKMWGKTRENLIPLDTPSWHLNDILMKSKDILQYYSLIYLNTFR